jgi:hypothetical protein
MTSPLLTVDMTRVFARSQDPPLPAEAPQEVNARQLYRAYLHKYAGADMKFWIFARQVDDMFEHYLQVWSQYEKPAVVDLSPSRCHV